VGFKAQQQAIAQLVQPQLKGNHTFQRSSFLHCTVKAIASHKASSAIAFSLRD
jgi:hypothetical protein